MCLSEIFSYKVYPIIETRLSFLVTPLVIAATFPLLRRYWQHLSYVFAGWMIAVSLYTYRNGFSIIFEVHPDKLPMVFHGDYLLMSRPYAGLYSAVAAVLLAGLITRQMPTWLKLVHVSGAVLLIAFLASIYSKMALVAVFLALSALLLFRLSRFHWAKVLMVSGVFLFFTFLTTGALGWILHQFEGYFKGWNNNIVHSLSSRSQIWDCGIKTLASGNIWLYGAGYYGAQEKLNDCYQSQGYVIGYNEYQIGKDYNAHNEFLQIWINTGLTGFLLTLCILALGYRQALIRSDGTFAGVLTVFLVVMFSESVFARQQGIMLFCTLYFLLYSRYDFLIGPINR